MIHIDGDGQEGIGEDVVYDVLDHIAHRDAGPGARPERRRRTLGELCELLGELDLFAGAPPGARRLAPLPPLGLRVARRSTWRCARTASRSARRSGATPSRCASSARRGSASFGDDAAARPPSRSESGSPSTPSFEFKLDPENDWDADADRRDRASSPASTCSTSRAIYRGTPVDVETDPELYRAVAEAFPDAYLEDPGRQRRDPRGARALRRPGHLGRAASLGRRHRGLEWQPKAINSKPSRFGSLAGAPRGLRALRARGDRDLRRRPGRAERRARADPVPRLAVSPHDAERRRSVGLQRPERARRASGQPDGPGAVARPAFAGTSRRPPRRAS